MVVAGAILTAWPLASASVALSDRQDALAVVLLVVGAALGSYLVPLLRARVVVGALYLTPGGMLHVYQARWWRTNWEDVIGTFPTEPLRVMLRPGARPEGGHSTRHLGWKIQARTPPDALLVDTRFLHLGLPTVAVFINVCAADPEARPGLGTPESVTWLNVAAAEAQKINRGR